MIRLRLFTPVLLVLAACGADPVRFDVPVTAEEATIPVSVGSVEIREVSLPLYAGQEVISVETVSGQLSVDDDLLWADDPVRAVTQGLAISLAAMTRARVAAEPWPFFENPDVRVEVRFADLLAQADGNFRARGQYFVASADGTRRDVARRFDLSVPYVAGNLASVAQAKARVIRDLSGMIARDGL